MSLKGIAKTRYQREYMRKRRAEAKKQVVRPVGKDAVRDSCNPDGYCHADIHRRGKQLDPPSSPVFDPSCKHTTWANRCGLDVCQRCGYVSPVMDADGLSR